MIFEEDKKQGRSAVAIIIIINAILFIPYLFRLLPDKINLYGFLMSHCGLNVLIGDFVCINNGAFWQVFTAMFLHGSVWHIILNMMTLYMFGSYLEQRWGSVQFVTFYLVVGVLANIASAIFLIQTKTTTCLIGASGAVVGVVLAFSGYCPNSRLLLFGFIPLKAKWALLMYIIIEFVCQIGGVSTSIAHFAHLFGLLFAFLYMIIVYHYNPIKAMWFDN